MTAIFLEAETNRNYHTQSWRHNRGPSTAQSVCIKKTEATYLDFHRPHSVGFNFSPILGGLVLPVQGEPQQ